ncbi:MAG: sodium:solute symporter family protein, partial [Acidobacteriota bacterium]|nr:sodium:solute symporter family protein [Acidobacteriota bacterium]
MPSEGQVHWGGLLSLVLFYALVVSVARTATQRHSSGTASDLMVARRRMPLWIGIFTMSATWVGGGYVNGTAEATYGSGLVWAQAPWGYALSLVIGGLIFARPMRQRRFTTMLDPMEQRYGPRVAGVLAIPALSGELFWTGAILTALGTTFSTVLGLNFSVSIIVSAAVAIAYTLLGGLWAVAFTDVVQLVFFMCCLWLVVPLAATNVGGLHTAWLEYQRTMGGLSLLPPWKGWLHPEWGPIYWSWWDAALLLIFGGVPWQVYFQRVLSSENEHTAVRLSLIAAVVCILAAIPAALVGVIGAVADWEAVGIATPDAAMVLPSVFRYLTSPFVASLGLGALAAAVMSSVDSSILSASSLGAWNVYRPLVNPAADSRALARVIRRLVIIVGVAATLLALRIQSVYALWFLCSDFVYCILFPQLVTALFDRKANRYGAVAGVAVSFILRVGGGEPVLAIPRLLPYPMLDPTTDAVHFPFRTTAMLAGLLTIMIVSRITIRRCPP